jgi:hypothetical protein
MIYLFNACGFREKKVEGRKDNFFGETEFL